MNSRDVVEGRDISPWSSMKFARARHHLAEFGARIELWNSSRVYTCPLRLTADRLFIEFLQPAGARPPLAEWGIILGDVVHNLRSSLDTLAWQYAHLDGGTPDDPRTIYFPIIRTADKWPAAAKRLQTVPTELLERIHEVQPFQTEGPPGEMHFLEALAEMDNRNKHREILQAAPSPGGMQLEGMSIRLEEDSPYRTEVHVEYSRNLNTVSDGEPIARFTFGAPLTADSDLPQSAHIGLTGAVQLNDNLMFAEDLDGFLLANVYRLLEYLRSGNRETAQVEGSRDPSQPKTG